MIMIWFNHKNFGGNDTTGYFVAEITKSDDLEIVRTVNPPTNINWLAMKLSTRDLIMFERSNSSSLTAISCNACEANHLKKLGLNPVIHTA
jgi:hypothetical protein